MAILTSQYFRFCLIAVAIAAPEVAFPLNSQVPPVARVGELFSFTFSPTTFTPNDESFQYTLADAPAWLNLDSASRQLSGIPGTADVGSPSFTLSASDGSGISSMQTTLVVVSFGKPRIGDSIFDALAKGGNMSGPSSVTFHPRSSLSFDFPGGLFAANDKKISYYATLSDHTPLPGWLAFDPQSLHFSGTTPPLSSSPQSFEVLIIASDIVGFAGAWVSFTIVVSDHQFYFGNVEQTLNIEPGEAVNTSDLRSHLLLDGRPVRDSEVTSAASSSPSWLSFDPHTLCITGTPPSGFKGQDISIAVHDTFGDVANMTLHLNNLSGLFVSEVGTLDATIGKRFDYTFDKSLFARTNFKLNVDLGSASNWLHFDSASMSIHGDIPSSVPAQTTNGEIRAVTLDGSQKDSRRFTIRIQAADAPTSTVSTRSSNSSAASPTGGVFAATGTPGKSNSSRTAGTVVGIVITVIFALFCMIIAVVYCRPPRKGMKRTRSALKRTISRPVPPLDEPWMTDMQHERGDLEKGSGGFERTPDHPPQIVLDLSPKKKARRSNHLGYTTLSPARQGHKSAAHCPNDRISVASSTIDDGDAVILDHINRTSLGYMGASTHKPHDSMRLATQMARASRQLDSISYTYHGQPSRHISTNRMSPALGRRSSAMRITSGGLPVVPRMAGLGHGRSPPGPNRDGILGIIQMQQQHRGSSVVESSTTRSTVSSFPPPPGSARLSRQSSHLGSQRRIIRDGMLIDPRRASVQRPVSRRGPQRSAFFSGGPSSRGSSSSRNRNTVLGLSTIHGSPDLGEQSPAAESSDALAACGKVPESSGEGMKPKSTPSIQRFPTQTSSRTAKTWQTRTTATSNTTSDASGETQPPPRIPPRNPAHTTHKRWSSSLLRTRLSRPFSSNTAASGGAERGKGLRDSALFASTDEDVNDTSADDDNDTRVSGSVYSQSSLAIASPEHERPPTRGKIPAGGVPIPPFTAPTSDSTPTSMMERPHPRASFRGAGTSVRAPLRSVRGGENRFSGSGFSSGLFGKQGKKEKGEKARLRGAREKRPHRGESVERAGGSMRMGREGVRAAARGDEAFL